MRHPFHALCPYFAMFPESFAEEWIGKLTKRDDVVYDPFAGRGTAPFQALLMDRNAVGLDINPVAYVVTKAKTHAPMKESIMRRLRALEKRLAETEAGEVEDGGEFFQWCFDPETLRAIQFLRGALDWRNSRVDAMIAALVLGSLHGDSGPNYLSNQMPRTIATKPAYSVRFWKARGLTPPRRDTFEILKGRLAFRYQSGTPTNQGITHLADMRDGGRLLQEGSVDCTVTSPPYRDVTCFEEDQWLRLWFLGGPPRPTTGTISTDDRHTSEDSYWGMIADMWRSLGIVVRDGGHVVVRLGSRMDRPEQLLSKLSAASVASGRSIRNVSSSVSVMQRRQTDAFRPGTKGVRVELDAVYKLG